MVPGIRSFAISWTAPAGTINHYIANVRTAAAGGGSVAGTCTVTITNCVIGQLTAGVAYYVTVAAYNSTDDSSGSATAAPGGDAANYPGPPPVPTGVTAAGGNSNVTVTWTAGTTPTVNPVATSYSVTGYVGTTSTVAGTCTGTVPGTGCVVSGLTPGTGYTFKVVANGPGNTGSSAASALSNGGTPEVPGPPGAPTNVVAQQITDTDPTSSATVSWTAPVGGLAVDHYTVVSTPGGFTCTDTDTDCNVATLVTGTSYTFVVTAYGGAGGSPAKGSTPSAASAAIVAGAPSAPRTVLAPPGNTNSAVSWTAPAYLGEAGSVDRYVATASPAPSGGWTGSNGSCTISGATTCTIPGLTAGTSYTVTVVAYGDGTATYRSPTSAASAAFVPGPPTVPAITGVTLDGAGGATVTWTQPSGVLVDKWIVRASPSGGTTPCVVDATTASPLPAKSCTVTGLAAGTSYTFIVTAYGAVAGALATDAGAGTNLTPATGVTPSVASTAVVTIAQPVVTNPVTAGNGQATVVWTQPAGATGIVRWDVQASPDPNASTSAGECSVTAAPLTCTVSGLLPGVSYTFVVTAVGATGAGSVASAASGAIYVGPPAKPVITGTTLAATSATVTWTQAAGATIDHYDVVASPSSGTTGCLGLASGSTTCTVTGLTPGTSYSFTVTAVGGTGLGSVTSDASAVVVPGTPAVPSITTLVPAKNSIKVTWAPATGVAVATYTVQAYTASTGVALGGATCTVPGSTLTCTVDEDSPLAPALTAGTAYTFKVTATAGGVTYASAMSDSVVPGPPNAAGNAFATPGDGFIAVTWTAPSSDTGTGTNGNAFLKYRATASDSDATTDDLFCESTVKATRNCIITGVTNQTEYTVTVSTYGQGDATNFSSKAVTGTVIPSAGPPSAPMNVHTTFGSGTVTVMWDTPGTIGDGITGYTVTRSPSGVPCVTDASTHQCVFTGLTDNTAYTFTVYANGAGNSGISTGASVVATPSAAASAPTGVVATAMEHAIKVDWVAGAGGGIRTGYTVTATATGETAKNCGVVAANATTCTISGLASGKPWTVTVQANSLGGNSSAVATTPATVIPGPPNAPVITEANETAEGAITVKWTAPVAGGVDVTGYVVTTLPDSGAHVCSDVVAPYECTLTGLTPGGTYSAVVTATAAAGLGSSSATSDSVLLHSLGAPNITSVTGGVGEITVNFSAGTGGLAIGSYAVTTTPDTGAHVCSDVTSPYSCVLTGLAAGSYTVTVTAMSSGGSTSNATSSSVTVTEPSTTVDPPVVTGVVSGVGTATVSWTAPAGVTVDHYSVAVTPNEGTNAGLPTVCDDVAGNADVLSCTVTDLTPGTSYTLTVTLHVDAVGGLTSEASSDAFVVGPPGMPTAVTAQVLGPRSIIVGWTAPSSTAGIASWRVQSTPGGVLCNQTNVAFRSCRFDNLVNGTRYTFKVMAIGDGDMGMSTSDASAVYTLNPALPGTVPASNGTLTSSRGTNLKLGQITTIGGQFYRPNTPLTIGIYPGPSVRGNPSATASGAFSVALAIPTNIGTGVRTIVVAGLNNAGVMRYMTLRINVTRPSAAGGAVIPGGASTPEGGNGTSTGSGMTVGGSAALPTTGNSITSVILAGFGILLAGLAAIGATYGAVAWRRRKFARDLTPAS